MQKAEARCDRTHAKSAGFLPLTTKEAQVQAPALSVSKLIYLGRRGEGKSIWRERWKELESEMKEGAKHWVEKKGEKWGVEETLRLL